MKQQERFTGIENEQFYKDVIRGLKMPQKQLPSKYFYDATGDKLFQDIMNCEDYYLTRCEMEIFTQQTDDLVKAILDNAASFDLIELGPGDCTKSIHLFKGLMDAGVHFNYIPIDISRNVIDTLQQELPAKLPGIKVTGLNGDYFKMLDVLSARSDKSKVILCLGGNLGNMTIKESHHFSKELRSHLAVGDMAIIGFDLMKHPAIIRNAYFDREGITTRFNLNLLTRMNRELHTDFVLDKFDHYCTYDPETGACKSYLICLDDLLVHFCDETISFKKNEAIWMEISQKHTLEIIEDMAGSNGFTLTKYFMDKKEWFTDAVWVAC